MKPGTYRPTTLIMASKHCPRAINFYHRGAEIVRRIFGVGIAVHAIIQAWIEETNAGDGELNTGQLRQVCDLVCERMIRDGRSFEGVPEPPLAADDVWAGADLARAYVERHPILPSTLLSSAEEGMAVDADWQPVKYSPDARLRLIADYVTVTEEVDEESSARILVVRDYKSAWSTDERELDTLQLKAQAVLAWSHHGFIGDRRQLPTNAAVDAVRQEVVNLRTGATFTRELWIDGDGLETLQRWQDELEVTMKALDDGRDEDGFYRVSPGGGCIGCPYVRHCEAGQDWKRRALLDDGSEELAEAWSSISKRLASLKTILKIKTDGKLLAKVAEWQTKVCEALRDLGQEQEAAVPIGDRATSYSILLAQLNALTVVLGQLTDDRPIAIPGGKVVGTAAVESRAVKGDAHEIVADSWTRRGGESVGLTKALNIGVAQVEDVAKVLYPDRQEIDERRQWVANLLESKTSRRFGIHKEE